MVFVVVFIEFSELVLESMKNVASPVREGREWKIRTTWAETVEQWVRNLLKTRGAVSGLDCQYVTCPDPVKFDDCK